MAAIDADTVVTAVADTAFVVVAVVADAVAVVGCWFLFITFSPGLFVQENENKKKKQTRKKFKLSVEENFHFILYFTIFLLPNFCTFFLPKKILTLKFHIEKFFFGFS